MQRSSDDYEALALDEIAGANAYAAQIPPGSPPDARTLVATGLAQAYATLASAASVAESTQAVLALGAPATQPAT